MHPQPLPCILKLLMSVDCYIPVLGLEMAQHVVLIKMTAPSGVRSVLVLAFEAYESLASQNDVLLQLPPLTFDSPLNQVG